MSVGGSAIKGSRIGSGPMGETERGEAAPRLVMSYWCANGHETTMAFAEEARSDVPVEWECRRCGLPAGVDRDDPPAARRNEPYKTHLAYVKERRSEAEGEALLEEALQALRAGRRLFR
ncbi:RNA polymerase-binding protein RbpA [Arsenicicoccus dermatophilus]|uniref:RNA polymerase-binding protein RbpA n=1 Tax=Arsenicicoccus dermatophilus TaxID=1076331 RepID=UPI003916D2E6